MKKVSLVLVVFMLVVSLSAETEYLGDGIYSNFDGPINIIVDTSMVARYIDSEYVMFMVYMNMDKDSSANINREGIQIGFNDQRIKMPTVKAFREAYKDDIRDIRVYKETVQTDQLISSKMAGFRIQWDKDFFPARNDTRAPADMMTISSSYISKTKVYIKNPGFKAGDEVIVGVKGSDDPTMVGSAMVVIPKTK